MIYGDQEYGDQDSYSKNLQDLMDSWGGGEVRLGGFNGVFSYIWYNK